jgi:transcriptional regulator with XRE-family HTH domain/tetratricopeptide (TPR) repeat protein
VAFFRRRRGLSQTEFAERLGRSESWVSQVERGVRSVDRLSMFERMANELGVSVDELRSEETSEEEVSLAVPGYVDDLRAVLSGPPSGAAVFGGRIAESAPGIRSLVAEVHAVWEMTHASQSEEACRRLSELLPVLEAGARRASGKSIARWFEALAWAYQAASAVLSVLGDADACWVAADRAMTAGERAGSSLLVVSGAHRLVLSFLRTGRVAQARLVAERTLGMLATKAGSEPAALLSLLGALHLALAIVAARDNNRQLAREHLRLAGEAASNVGEGRNDFHTEFGPANVGVHSVAVAIELGDAGEALDAASRVDVSQLSEERQARFLIDVARAYAQRRRRVEAVRALRDAQQLAPEYVQEHSVARELVRDLIGRAGTQSEELRELAQGMDVIP